MDTLKEICRKDGRFKEVIKDSYTVKNAIILLGGRRRNGGETTTERFAQTASVLHFLFAPSSNSGLKSLLVTHTGADINTCGWEDLPCLTVAVARTHHTTATTVKLGDGVHTKETEDLEVASGQVLQMEPVVESEDISAIKFKTAITVTISGDCTFLNFTFIPSTSITHSFFVIEDSGKLSLSSIAVSAESGVTVTKSLFTFTAGTLITTATTISNISRTVGNGAVFEFEDLTSNVQLSGMTVTNCTSQTGGSLFASLSANAQLILSDLSFSYSSADAKGKTVYINLASNDSKAVFGQGLSFASMESDSANGQFIYIACSAGDESANLCGWTSLGDYESLKSSLTNYWLEETTVSRTKQNTSLLYFLYPPSIDAQVTQMYVSLNGADILTCGWTDLPCATLDIAFKQRSTLSKISLLDTVSLTSPLKLTSDTSLLIATATSVTSASLTITSQLEDTTQSTVIENAGTLAISTLTLALDTSLSAGSSVCSLIESSAALSLSDLTFTNTTADPISISLLRITSGTFSADSISLSSLAFSDSVTPVFLSHGIETASFIRCTINQITLFSSFFTISSSSSSAVNSIPQITITQSQMNLVTMNSLSTLPSLLALPDFTPVDLTVSSSTISSCTSPNSRHGGAVLVTLPVTSSPSGSLTIVDCQIQNCACNLNEGRGGFLYVDLVPSASLRDNTQVYPLTLSNLTFENNEAYIGRDIYIRYPPDESLDSYISLDLNFSSFDIVNSIYGCVVVDPSSTGSADSDGVFLDSQSGEIGDADSDSSTHDTSGTYDGSDADSGVSGSNGSSSTGSGTEKAGTESDRVDVDIIELLYRYTSTTIYANSTHPQAIDNALCGSPELPCNTLAYASGHVLSGPTSSLIFTPGTICGREFSINGFKLIPSVTDTSGTVIMTAAEDAAQHKQTEFIAVYNWSIIENVDIRPISGSSNIHTVFLSASGVDSLVIKSTQFRPVSEDAPLLTILLLSLNNSILELTSVSIESFSIASHPLIHTLFNSQVTFTDSIVSSITSDNTSIFAGPSSSSLSSYSNSDAGYKHFSHPIYFNYISSTSHYRISSSSYHGLLYNQRCNLRI